MADERAAIMTHLVGSRHPEPAWAEGGREAMTAAAIPLSVPLDEYLPVCTAQPERWTTTTPDEYAKAACQACPRRWLCASEACQVPGVEGLWAGVVIPESGRSREFALRRLRYLAERGGYQARPRRRGRPRGSRN